MFCMSYSKMFELVQHKNRLATMLVSEYALKSKILKYILSYAYYI